MAFNWSKAIRGAKSFLSGVAPVVSRGVSFLASPAAAELRNRIPSRALSAFDRVRSVATQVDPYTQAITKRLQVA